MKIRKNYQLIIVVLTLIIFSNFTSIAQEAQSFGVKGGVVFSSLSNIGDFNIKPGLQAGGYAQFGGGEVIFFQSEFLITQKGSWNWNASQPRNFSLYYIDIPLMFGIDLIKDFTFNIGIQPSVLIGGTLRTSEDGDTNWRNLSNNLTRFDFSTLFGVEYDLQEQMFIGIRFNYGFVPLQNYQGELTIENDGKLISNRAFQIYLGYKLK